MVQYFDFISMLLSFVFDAMKFKNIGIWLNKSGNVTATEKERRTLKYNNKARVRASLYLLYTSLII